MQLIVEHRFHSRRRLKLRLQQIALWLATCILVVQLIGMAFHNHGLAEQSSHCVSCDLAAAFPSPVPSVPLPALAPALVFVYRTAIALAYAFVPAQNNFLIPYSQAPPPVSSVV